MSRSAARCTSGCTRWTGGLTIAAGRARSRNVTDRGIPIALSGELARIVGADAIMVNSLHGQAIERPAPGMVVEAVAADGTIEAVRVATARGFALGVQWHPEWGFGDNPASLAIFRAFGAACGAYRLGINRKAA